jgi:hypothetical protein
VSRALPLAPFLLLLACHTTEPGVPPATPMSAAAAPSAPATAPVASSPAPPTSAPPGIDLHSVIALARECASRPPAAGKGRGGSALDWKNASLEERPDGTWGVLFGEVSPDVKPPYGLALVIDAKAGTCDGQRIEPTPKSAAPSVSDAAALLALARRCAEGEPHKGRGIQNPLLLDRPRIFPGGTSVEWRVYFSEKDPVTRPSGLDLAVNLSTGRCLRLPMD